jgi:hypothetical protein
MKLLNISVEAGEALGRYRLSRLSKPHTASYMSALHYVAYLKDFMMLQIKLSCTALSITVSG